MTPPLAPLTSLGGGPPEEDRLLIRALRVEVRQALARLNADDEGNDPARVRQVIRDCIEAHQRRAFSTTNTPRLIDPHAAEQRVLGTSLRHVSPKHERRQWPQSYVVGPLGTAS